MNKMVYLVIGRTGTSGVSDEGTYHEWIVCGCNNMDVATLKCNDLNMCLHEVMLHYDNIRQQTSQTLVEYIHDMEARTMVMLDFDPTYDGNREGSSYFVKQIQLVE